MTRPPLFISRSSRADVPAPRARTRATLYLVALLTAAIGFYCGYHAGAETRPGPSLRLTPPGLRPLDLDTPRLSLPEDEPPPRRPILLI